MPSRLARVVLVILVTGASFFLIGRSCRDGGPPNNPDDRGGVAKVQESQPLMARENSNQTAPDAPARIEDVLREYSYSRRSTNNVLVKKVEGVWSLRTKRDTILELTLIGGEGRLAEQFFEAGENVMTEQTVIASPTDEAVVVTGFDVRLVGDHKKQHKFHPSVLLFVPKDGGFQIFWRYTDSNDSLTPVEVRSHEP